MKHQKYCLTTTSTFFVLSLVKMLSRVSRIALRSIARPLAASVKVQNNVVYTQSANFAVSNSLISSVSKNLKREISGFTADIDDCSEELKNLGATATVNAEGDIVIEFKNDKFDVSVKFNQEFEYDDDADQENFEYDENQRNDEDNADEDNADDTAFHTVTTNLKTPKGLELQLVGTLSLSGDYQIDSFVPIKNGVETRRITTTDMEQDTLDGYVSNHIYLIRCFIIYYFSAFELVIPSLSLSCLYFPISIFDVLEAAGINQDFSDFLVKYARYQRLNRHVDALKALNEFVTSL